MAIFSSIHTEGVFWQAQTGLGKSIDALAKDLELPEPPLVLDPKVALSTRCGLFFKDGRIDVKIQLHHSFRLEPMNK